MSVFNNGLTPIPEDALLYQYQRLARSGRLWFYDDHQQVVDLLPSTLPNKPGFVGLVYNRDTGNLTSTYYKFLGRAFLTTPEALKAPLKAALSGASKVVPQFMLRSPPVVSDLRIGAPMTCAPAKSMSPPTQLPKRMMVGSTSDSACTP